MIEKDKITVKVSGSGKNKRALVEEATRFFSNKLMPRMKTLTININLNPPLSR